MDAGPAEIDLAHARVGAISSGVPSSRIAPPTITMMRLAKRNTTFMSCSMNSTEMSLGQRRRSPGTARALSSRGTPAAGSSSSSTFGLRGQRQRDFEKALLAVGEFSVGR